MLASYDRIAIPICKPQFPTSALGHVRTTDTTVPLWLAMQTVAARLPTTLRVSHLKRFWRMATSFLISLLRNLDCFLLYEPSLSLLEGIEPKGIKTCQPQYRPLPTTAGLIQAAQSGELRKYGEDTLIDQNGNVVANRIGAQGGCDYYADAQQGFPAGGPQFVSASVNRLEIYLFVTVGVINLA